MYTCRTSLLFLSYSILSLTTFILTSTTSLLAEDEAALDNRFMVVLDASGSMWGQIADQTKIEIARSVIGDLVQDWDSSTEVGLVAYGHRKKGDCKDIEVITPLAPLDQVGFTKSVNRLTPKGMTPLSDAVIKAAETLKYTEQKATVILVSDGIETCDQDPCAVANRLEKSGVNFTTHVIGFDVANTDDQKQLKCLAENTGGSFYSADNAASLKSALQSAVEEAVPVAPPVEKSNSDVGVTVAAVFEAGGPVFEDVYFEFFDTATTKKKHVGRAARNDDGSIVYRVSPGTYRVVVHSRKGSAKAEKEITVTAEEIVREEIIIAREADVKLVAVHAAGGEPLEDVYWEVRKQNNKKRVEYGGGNTPVYRLEPGDYTAKVNSRQGQATAEHNFTLQLGDENVVEVVLSEEGQVVLSAHNEEGGPALEGVYWQVYNDKDKRIDYGGGNTPTYQLLPGTYIARVTSQKGEAETKHEFVVQPGKKDSIQVLMAQEGRIQLAAVIEEGGDPLPGVYWNLYRMPKSALGKKERVSYGGGANPTYQALPGKYVVQVKSSKGKAEVEQEVEVVAGELTKIDVLFPSEGEIELVAVTEAGGDPLDKIYYNVFQPAKSALSDPKRVDYGGGNPKRFRLLPGKYIVKAKSSKGKAEVEQEVEVLAGERVRTEVLMPAEGRLQLAAVLSGQDVPVTSVYWTIYDIPKVALNDPKRVDYSGAAEPTFQLLPGKYRVQAKNNKSKEVVEKEIEVLAGQVVTDKLEFEAESAEG